MVTNFVPRFICFIFENSQGERESYSVHCQVHGSLLLIPASAELRILSRTSKRGFLCIIREALPARHVALESRPDLCAAIPVRHVGMIADVRNNVQFVYRRALSEGGAA